MTTTATVSPNRVSRSEVIIILLILVCGAAILLPALPASRETARANLCRFNLRKLDQTTQIYINDHPRFPEPSTWPVELLPHLFEASTPNRLQLGMAIFEMTRPWMLTCPAHPNATEELPAKQMGLYTLIVDRNERVPLGEIRWRFRDRPRQLKAEEAQPWYIGVELDPQEARAQLNQQGPHQGRFLESRGDGAVDFAVGVE